MDSPRRRRGTRSVPHRLHALLDDSSGKPLITRNARLLEILGLLRQAAPTDAAILIEGESGTGKSLIARHIHDLSTRRARPFVEINCAALPEGLIESELFGHVRGAFTGALDGRVGRFKAANGGTLFLDEIDDLPPALQPKLLRAIQDQCFEPVGSDKTERVDVRIVAAANRGLVNLIREGAFRSDLYYRLAVIQIDIPPLRQRPGDVPLLCDHILERLAARGYPRATLSPEATQALLDYPWPGNVRELENALEHGVICARAGKIFKDGLPWHVRHGTVLSNLDTVTADRDQGDRTAILEALRSARGNRSEAARLLGIDRTTLWRRMQRLGLGSDAEADG